jgi:hypothetical protein
MVYVISKCASNLKAFMLFSNWNRMQCVHSMYTVCTQYVRSLYAACTQYVHSMYTVCTQYVPSMYAVCTQHVRSLYPVCTQSVNSMYAVCTQSVHSMYSVCTQYVRSLYAVLSQSLRSMYAVCTQYVHSIVGCPSRGVLCSQQSAVSMFSSCVLAAVAAQCTDAVRARPIITLVCVNSSMEPVDIVSCLDVLQSAVLVL